MSSKYFIFAIVIFLFCCPAFAFIPMNIDNGNFTRISGQKFRIEVKGIAPTPGWKVTIRPRQYMAAPKNWEMDVIGTRPSGFVAQVLTPYKASLDFNVPPSTTRVTLVGKNRQITLNLPKSKPPINLMPVSKGTIRRAFGNRFSVTVSGMAPTPGWKVKLHVPSFEVSVKNANLKIIGTPPSGMVIQMLSPYSHTQEVVLPSFVEKVVLIGKNQRNIIDVPWRQGLMGVETATIKRISKNKLKITVKGTAPTPGWKVSEQPYQYKTTPTNWEIAIAGKAPSGFVAQVLTPYSYSFEFSIPTITSKISIIGNNQKLILNIPHSGGKNG